MTEITFDSIKLYFYLSSAWTEINDWASSTPFARWGMPSPRDRLASTGSLSFSLDNSGGLYTPDGASALTGWAKGTPVKIVFTYNGETFTRFKGVVEHIKVDSGTTRSRKAHVTVLDWLDYAAKYPLDIPTVEEDKTADYTLQTIVDNMPIAPSATDFEEGTTEFPTIFDSATIKTRGYSEFSKVVNSEPGLGYLIKDQTEGETLVFKNALARDGLTPLSTVSVEGDDEILLFEDGDELLFEDSSGNLLLNNATVEDVVIDNEFLGVETEYGADLINQFSASAYPKRISADTSLIYSLEKPLYFSSGQERTFRVQYTDPTSKRILAALPPTDDGTVVLLKGEGGSFTSVIADETGREWTNPANDVQNVTTQVKFGNGSLYFDGSTSYITSADSPDFNFGTDDFTVEWWEYRFASTANMSVCRRSGTSVISAYDLGRSDGTNLRVHFSSAGASYDIKNGGDLGTITLNTWVHRAICRSGSNWYLFKDGTLTDSWTSSASIYVEASDIAIGRNNATYLNACIDDFRIVYGTAKYTGAFTPSTTGLFASGVYFTAGTTATGGTSLKDDFVVTVDYGGVGADITVSNMSTSNGYLQTLNISSYIVQSDVPIVNIVEDTTSVNAYGYQPESLQMSYQQDTDMGVLEGLKAIEENKNPKLRARKVTMNANRNHAMMSYFCNMDVGDLVQITEDKTEINSLYWINGVEFQIIGGKIVNFSWILKECRNLTLGLSPIAVEFDASSTDGLFFGYIPVLDEAIHGEYSISAWVYIDGSTGNTQEIFTIHSDNGGVRLALTSADNRKMFLYDSLFTDSALGVWTSSGLEVTYGAWHHLVVTYNSLAASDPIFYIDGSAVATTETSTPTGVKDTGTNPLTVIGNLKTATIDYSRPTDGKIKDVRLYNRIISSAEVTTLRNGGTPDASLVTDGLAFQAPCVKTEQVTDYQDTALTDGMNVVDNIHGYVGVPNGTPTGREF